MDQKQLYNAYQQQEYYKQMIKEHASLSFPKNVDYLFKELVSRILNKNPEERPCIGEILEHEWLEIENETAEEKIVEKINQKYRNKREIDSESLSEQIQLAQMKINELKQVNKLKVEYEKNKLKIDDLTKILEYLRNSDDIRELNKEVEMHEKKIQEQMDQIYQLDKQLDDTLLIYI